MLAGLVAVAIGVMALMGWFYSEGYHVTEKTTPRADAMPVPSPMPSRPAVVQAPVAETIPTPEAPKSVDGKWDGPILYRAPGSDPVDLILVEKAIQKLHLYRYDGSYRLVKTYACATGENDGPKRREKDERTPVGIYFNTKSYRDNKITVFGDRAFELNYPDPFDRLAGNGGSGIFIHGSNREVKPNSTNGCVALDNKDLADLDGRVRFEQTPVIIGDRLPYRFASGHRKLTAVLPFLQKAMVPEAHAGKPADFQGLTLIGFKDRMVAFGSLKIGDHPRVQGVSRLYLADASNDLLVLFKREWAMEEAVKPLVATVAVAATAPAAPVEPSESMRIKGLVASWQQAWQGKRLEDYIGHYHSAFASSGRSLAQWKDYKGRLNRRYKKISVSVSDLRVKMTGGRAEAYFKQRYRSDAFRSDGFKVLVFRKEAGRWKIYRENSHAVKPAGWPA
ncbi:MAG: L,D-transpeptidase family protein [Desulfobacterales bacterium]|nr:L,D-transpeptidase family protein [Desulfobacterales bacterium]